MPTELVRGLKAHGPSPAKGILGLCRARYKQPPSLNRTAVAQGRVRRVVMKITLDNPDVEEAQFLGLLRKRERVAKVVRAGFLIGPDVGKNCTLSVCSAAQCPISARQKSSERGGADMFAMGCGEQVPYRCATQLSPKQASST
jgi:hypothetical protein